MASLAPQEPIYFSIIGRPLLLDEYQEGPPTVGQSRSMANCWHLWGNIDPWDVTASMGVSEAAGETFVTYSCGQVTVEPDATTVFVPNSDGRHRLGVTVDAEEFLRWLSPRLLG